MLVLSNDVVVPQQVIGSGEVFGIGVE